MTRMHSAIYGAVLAVGLACTGYAVELRSPDGMIRFELRAGDGLAYAVERNGRPIVANAPVSLEVAGVDYCRGVDPGDPQRYRIDEVYPWRGVKSWATNRCNGLNIPVLHRDSGKKWVFEARAYDDGVAFRMKIPFAGEHPLARECVQFAFDRAAVGWYQDNFGNYEGNFHPGKPLWKLESKKVLALPLTLEFPDGSYGVLSEANVFNYGHTRLRSKGSGVFETFNAPVRSGEGRMSGDISTSWKTLMLVDDLNAMVNSTLIFNLMPPPDPDLFPEGMRTAWLKPGRCLWQWWAYSGGGLRWDRQKKFIDQAAGLNCRYYLADEGWEKARWGWVSEDRDQWAALKELCEYGRTKDVEVLVWAAKNPNQKQQWPGVDTPAKLTAFLDKVAAAGARGVKFDFIYSDSYQSAAWYEMAARECAKRKLLVNFHGCAKPAGEIRTYPNEMTREAIHGLEFHKRRDARLPLTHYAALPFTRLLQGPADFTPTTFQEKSLRGTSFSLQLATAVVYTSPWLTWADKFEVYRDSPAFDLVRQLPTAWDETVVLPGSKIGGTVAFARRKGGEWWIGIINGVLECRDFDLDLSFLDQGRYKAVFVKDDMKTGLAAMVREKLESISPDESYRIKMRPGGGFVARIMPE